MQYANQWSICITYHSLTFLLNLRDALKVFFNTVRESFYNFRHHLNGLNGIRLVVTCKLKHTVIM